MVWAGRLKYVTSFYGLVDLATILPFYVEQVTQLVIITTYVVVMLPAELKPCPFCIWVPQILKHVPGYSFDGTIFRIFRMLRLFQVIALCHSHSPPSPLAPPTVVAT